MKYISNILLVATAILSCLFLGAQSGIKLFRGAHYILRKNADGIRTNSVPIGSNEARNILWERGYHNISFISQKEFDRFYQQNSSNGIAKITSTSGVQVNGYYVYSGLECDIIFEMYIDFPAIKSIQKIELFDKDGICFFVDVYDDLSVPQVFIEKIGDNIFKTNNDSLIYVSYNNAISWDMLRIDRNTGIFSTNTYSDIIIVSVAYGGGNPSNIGTAIWSNRPGYTLEFADVDIPGTQASSSAAIKNKNPSKGVKAGGK